MTSIPSAVILEPKEIKSDTVSTVSASISHEVMNRISKKKRRRYDNCFLSLKGIFLKICYLKKKKSALFPPP